MSSDINGHGADVSPPNGPDVAPPPPGKKGRQRKLVDTSDTSRLLQARISQLEQDAAGEKDQEAEIGTRRAARNVNVSLFPAPCPSPPFPQFVHR